MNYTRENMKKERVKSIALPYYSRKDVLQAMFNFSKDREISPRYFEGFGKRPDMLHYPSDILSLVKKGATSFHCSEEIWNDPLAIATGMSDDELNTLRKGWDLIIDIDCQWIEYSKKAALSIIQALKSQGVENIGTKFSVAGETPILIKLEDKTKLLSISEAIDLFKKGIRFKVLSLDKDKKLSFSKVYDYLEHKDTLYEIYHDQSTIPVKATKHHSVFIWDKGEILEKKVEEIKEGNFLVTFNSKKNPLSKEIKEVENEFEFAKNQFSKKKVRNKVKITKDLMRLIGYFLAEGHVTNTINQVGFSFNKNEIDYIEDCKSLLSKITGRKISIRNPNAGSTQILIHSKEWASFFDKYCGKKKNKHLPEFSWNLKKDLFLEMLLGYIRGDGHKTGEYTITIKSVSKRLTTELVWLCKLNGISCSLSYEQNKTRFLPQGTLFRGSLTYMIKIPKSEIPLEFYRKRNKFSPYPRDRTFPIDGLKQVYKQIKPKMFNYHRPEQMSLNKKRANLARIDKVIKWFLEYKSEDLEENSKKILDNYRSLFNSEIGIVEIKKINKKNKEKVFDISVEKTETFFGNNYPVLLHNSGSKGFHIIIPWEAFPQEVNGVKTSDMFPEWPRAVIGYIKELSRPRLAELIKDTESDFRNVEGFTGVKCENCNNLAETRFQITVRCDKCSPPHIETFKTANENYRKKKCPIHLKHEMQEKSKTKFHYCPRCNLNSLDNKTNFNESVIATDIFKVLGLDVLLVSPRHLFRMPYSLHEKTALASIVLDKDQIENFDIKDASPLSIMIKDFTPKVNTDEAKKLLLNSIDWEKSQKKEEKIDYSSIQGETGKKKFEPLNLKHVKEEMYPPTINKILAGMQDGRKRALFVLLNFFRSLGLNMEEVEEKIRAWNKLNKPPIKEGYLKSQFIWHAKHNPVMPPNFDNEIYKAIGVLDLDPMSEKAKNPVSYVSRRSFAQKKKSRKKPKRKTEV